MPQSNRFGVCNGLIDGDVLLVMIDQADKEKPIDPLIRGGELLQQTISFRKWDAIESHVMLFTDLRPAGALDQANVPLLRPDNEGRIASFSHVIHSEPGPTNVGGVVGSQLYSSKGGHSEELLVLRCTDRQLAQCASQIATELFLGATQKYYDWGHYAKIGLAYGLKAYSYASLAWNVGAAVYSGGLYGLVGLGASYLTKTTVASLGLGALVNWWTSETQYTQQNTMDMGTRGQIAAMSRRLPKRFHMEYPEFSLFSQFHNYYEMRTGQLKQNLSVGEVCSSFVILCYQLAYIKLVRYFNHGAIRELGPRRIQSPTGMRELFVESGLFAPAGCIDAAYDATNPAAGSPEATSYARRFSHLLAAKAAQFPLQGKAGRAAESPI